LVRQVGGVLVGMPYPWRWVSVSRRATLAERRRHLQDQLDLAVRPAVRSALQAEVAQLDDMVERGINQIDHYLVAWPRTSAERASLPGLVQAGCGRVTVQAGLPNVWGAATYDGRYTSMQARGEQHAWRGLLSTGFVGSVLPDLFSGALLQPFPTIVVVDSLTVDPETAQQQLESARQRLSSHAAGYQAQHTGRDLAQQHWQDAGMLLQEGSLLHHVQVAVFARGSTPQRAVANSQQLAQTLGATITLRPADGHHHHLAQFASLASSDQIAVSQEPHPMVTPQVATLLPWGLRSQVQSDGLLLGYDLMRAMPLYRPVERLAAQHAAFYGMTGTGKTTLIIMWLRRLIDHFGYQGIVFDPQHAFRDAAAAYPDASYTWVSLQPQPGQPRLRLNVLDPVVDDLATGLLEQIEHVTTLLSWLNEGPFTSAQRLALDLALTTLYAGLVGVDTRDLGQMPLLSDLYDVLLRHADDSGVAAIVARWTQGAYADLYNQPTTIDVRFDPATPLIVYDFDPIIPERIRTFFLTLITAASQRELRRRPRRCVTVIDEYGVLARDPVLARYAETYAKVMRRFSGALWVADQGLETLDTQAGREILNNSFITVLGLLHPLYEPTLRQMFPNLSDGLVAKTLGVGRETDSALQEAAGKFTLLFNGQTFQIYNELSSYELALMPRRATMVTDAGGMP
jgi:hypothetical protein